MLSYRFANEEQKRVNLAILRDLLLDNKNDQPAKTALSNAIIMAEATMVSGALDEMIEKTNRWYRRSTRWLSVFFVALAMAEFGFAALQGFSFGALGQIFFGVALLTYCWALQGMWRIQRAYHDTLKRLETMQLEMPPVPTSLTVVRH